MILAISTSAGQFALLLGENNNVLFDSRYIKDSFELDFLLLKGLEMLSRGIEDIKNIIVDIGPGGTSSVRTGVSFANALAYSLDIAIAGVSSMELAGIDAYFNYNIPVIFTVKSLKDNAFIGFFNNNKIENIYFDKIEDKVPLLVEGVNEFVVAGAHRERIMNMEILKNKKIINSEMTFGNAKILIEKSSLFLNRSIKFPELIEPINENKLAILRPPCV